MGKPKNVVVAHWGGPTPVIKGALRGGVGSCREQPERFGTVYAGVHRVERILREQSEATQWEEQ